MILGVVSFPIINMLFQYAGVLNVRRSNSYIQSFYEQHKINASKRSFLLNYKCFNRKFTPEEMDQFVFNIKLKYRGPKLYHYNPYIHGEDESQHQQRHDMFNQGVQFMSQEMIQNISQSNKSKTENGETIQMAPFKVNEHLDVTGKLLGIRHLNLFGKANTI